MLFDIDRANKYYNSLKPEEIPYIIVNEMCMTEYIDWLTIDKLREYISEHNTAIINGHGMQELLRSGRNEIVKYVIESGRYNYAAKEIYDTYKSI